MRRGLKVRRSTLYPSVIALILAFLLGVILHTPEKAYAISEILGLPGEAQYFSLHRQTTYGEAEWHDEQRDGAKVYLIGDSMLAGHDVSDLADSVLNVAVGGERAGWLVNEADQLAFTRKGACVVINLGINDLAYGAHPMDVAAHLDDLLSKYQGQQVLLGEALPVTPIFTITDSEKLNPVIRQLNAQADKVCAAHRHCTRLAWYQQFVDEKGVPKAELFRNDGIHLSRAGYAVFGQTLRAGLKEQACL
ncbi:MAG: GDSL-type esterase/lipase family protein [Aquisalinus sp.]|nr:GDSL-type esterase/lipase family protein [Aquisalinus sp.]